MAVHVDEAEAYELQPSTSEGAALLNDVEDMDSRTSQDVIKTSVPLREEHDGEETVGKGTNIEALIARVSPSSDVQAFKLMTLVQTVPSTDDPSLPTLTLRTVLLGSVFCILGASASQVFYFKSNAPSFSAYFVILSTYPLGHLLANERVCRRGRRFLGMELNPGPFSIKEAILVRSAGEIIDMSNS